jgi:arylsulfatase
MTRPTPIAALLASLTSAAWAMAQGAHPQPDRTVLPLAAPKTAAITELDARNAKVPPRFEVRAPERRTS